MMENPGSNGNAYAGSDSNSSKSPLERLGFGKFLTGEKKTRDGQPPKRRGPKPDSKPALTRRQELNRQAQRTHRERKEMYIKALEQEVLRLKEVFGQTTRERDAFAEENKRLREILAAHGIQWDHASPGPALNRMGSSFGGSTSSLSGSYAPGSASTGYTSPPNMPSRPPPPLPPGAPFDQQQMQQHQHQQGLDYDQIGIDFVLTLERPCMDHMQFLMVRSTDSEEAEISGHALMATCPPQSHINDHPEEKYPHKMPDIGPADLVRLLDLSNRLPLDGEITPIMAWASIRQHPRAQELTPKDFATMKEELKGKIRCYGFGAVLEEFEVRDALQNIFALKPESFPVFSPADQQQWANHPVVDGYQTVMS